MSIAFFTESEFEGKISRDFDNMRTEYAWYVVLNSTHHSITKLHTLDNKMYDLGIVIIPKMNLETISQYPMIKEMKRICNKIGFMQEGPHWYFQDYPMEQQIWFYNCLIEMDVIFCHNNLDVKYFKGFTGKTNVYRNQSLMITDYIRKSDIKQDSVMIGGNMCRWYGGFDSYIVAQKFDCLIYAPSMGRKIDREDEMDINHLPYMTWLEWQTELSKHRYAVHLMTTHAAGTFALNCAYLGIPCIGYRGLDTQEECHPNLSVGFGDLDTAVKLAKMLKEDNEFYTECSELAKYNFKTYFGEETYIYNMNKILNKVIDG